MSNLPSRLHRDKKVDLDAWSQLLSFLCLLDHKREERGNESEDERGQREIRLYSIGLGDSESSER